MKKILISLFLMSCLSVKAQKHSVEYKNQNGIVLTFAGMGFTTAAISEGNGQYGTYTSNINGTMVQQPAWKQTPRNIMFVFGVTLTVTGLITMLSNR